MQLEAVKQLNPMLNSQQRRMLVDRLEALHLPLRDIKEMAASVEVKHTFNTIAFEYWVEDLVALRSEITEEKKHLQESYNTRVREEAKRLLEARIDEAKKELSPEGEAYYRRCIELQSLEDAISIVRQRRDKWAEEVKQSTKKKLALVRSHLVAMDRESRKRIVAKAVERGEVKTFDDTMIENIQYFPDVLMGAFDDLFLETSVKAAS